MDVLFIDDHLGCDIFSSALTELLISQDHTWKVWRLDSFKTSIWLPSIILVMSNLFNAGIVSLIDLFLFGWPHMDIVLVS